MNNSLDRRLLLISFLLHVGMIFGLALFYPNSLIKKTFLVFGSHSRYPSHAYFHRPHLKGSVSLRMGADQRKSGIKKSKTSGQEKKKEVAAVQEQVVSKKTALVQTQILKEHAVIKKTKHKSKAPQKRENKKQKLEVKRDELKKIEEEPVEKKAEEQPKKVEEKAPEKKKEQKTEQKKQLIAQTQKEEKFEVEKPEQNVSVEEQSTANGVQSALVGQEEVMQFNLMGETDASILAYQQCIQREVERLWCPPIGVARGTECVVCFMVSKDGAISDFNIVRPSRMVIYDLSIVRVAKNFLFDKMLWGKTFTITFRQ